MGSYAFTRISIKVISHVQQTHSLPLYENQRYAWETFRKAVFMQREKERVERIVSQLT